MTPTATSDAHPQKSHLPSLNISVVDDEPLVLKTLAWLLAFDGHVVHAAHNGREALVQFQPGWFHLVITDFAMPAMTGQQLSLAIKTRCPTQAVLLLTADAQQSLDRDRPPDGVELVLQKPVGMSAFRGAIQRLTSSGPAPEDREGTAAL